METTIEKKLAMAMKMNSTSAVSVAMFAANPAMTRSTAAVRVAGAVAVLLLVLLPLDAGTLSGWTIKMNSMSQCPGKRTLGFLVRNRGIRHRRRQFSSTNWPSSETKIGADPSRG